MLGTLFSLVGVLNFDLGRVLGVAGVKGSGRYVPKRIYIYPAENPDAFVSLCKLSMYLFPVSFCSVSNM